MNDVKTKFEEQLNLMLSTARELGMCVQLLVSATMEGNTEMKKTAEDGMNVLENDLNVLKQRFMEDWCCGGKETEVIMEEADEVH